MTGKIEIKEKNDRMGFRIKKKYKVQFNKICSEYVPPITDSDLMREMVMAKLEGRLKITSPGKTKGIYDD